MKVKIAVACKYFVKKEVDLPDDVVGKLEERMKLFMTGFCCSSRHRSS